VRRIPTNCPQARSRYTNCHFLANRHPYSYGVADRDTHSNTYGVADHDANPSMRFGAFHRS
jgi:hypothetical protein